MLPIHIACKGGKANLNLVKLLMEKSERLKEDAAQSSLLLDVAQRMTAFPGLCLLGQSAGNKNPVLQQMGKDALQAAKATMSSKKDVQAFLSENASLMLDLIQKGLPVDDPLVEELVSRPVSLSMLKTVQLQEEEDDGTTGSV